MMDFSKIKNLSIGGINLKELYIDGVQVWRAGILPNGYIQLNYIETETSTGSWIDTGVNAYTYNDKILQYNFKGMVTGYRVSSGNNYLFGCLNNGQRSGNVSLRGDAVNKTSIYLGGSSAQAFNCDYMPVRGEDFEVNFYGNSTVRDISGGTMVSNDGTSYEFKYSAMTLRDMPNATIYLGHCNGTTTGNSRGFKGKIYYFSIGTTDGIAIREMIPCINPNGVVGMYDTVSKSFYTNTEDSLPFTAGNIII